MSLTRTAEVTIGGAQGNDVTIVEVAPDDTVIGTPRVVVNQTKAAVAVGDRGILGQMSNGEVFFLASSSGGGIPTPPVCPVLRTYIKMEEPTYGYFIYMQTPYDSQLIFNVWANGIDFSFIDSFFTYTPAAVQAALFENAAAGFYSRAWQVDTPEGFGTVAAIGLNSNDGTYDWSLTSFINAEFPPADNPPPGW